MARILLKDLTKKFNNVVAVNQINLEIFDKEFVVLVGPSGCGKTTTLRMVAGLEELTGGQIFIGDRVVNELPPKDRNLAMVFQNYALYPNMNVYDNMAYGLKMRKTPREEIRKRVYDAAKILGIEDLLERKPKQLSGGQRQRVAVGRAIVRQPEAFLFDEPLSNLDAKLRVKMRGEIKKLHERLKTTILYVTHDQVEAMTMADRVVVMKNGFIQQVGAPLDLFDKPENMFVAGFIGSPSMNFFKAEVQSRGSAVYLVNRSFELRIPDGALPPSAGTPGRETILGIRPEHISLYGRPDHEKIQAKVLVIEPLGAEVILELEGGEESFYAKVEAPVAVSTQENLDLYFNMRKIHLFHPQTEKRIN
jgi:multiple sugar transport system ATP-binding protein